MAQLPLPTPEEDIKAKKAQKESDIRKKRLTLIVLLVGTIGLCVSFWTYRYFKTNPIRFTVPTIKSTPSRGNISPNSELKKLLSKNKTINTFHLKVTNPFSEYFYGQKYTQIPNIDKNTSRLTTKSDFPLPEALVYKENITPTESTINISTPGRNLYIHLKYSDINLINSDLASIVYQSYWSVFGN